MATITGLVANFKTQSMGLFSAEVWFVPSGPGLGSTNAIITAQPIVVPVASDGTFTVNLQPTTTLRPRVWFDVSVRYLDAGGNYIRVDEVGTLEVNGDGGQIASLIGVQMNPGLAWWAASDPPGVPVTRALWLDPTNGVLKMWS